MTDVEKVIKGLECCRIDENGNRHVNCADCPYYTDDDKGEMWCSNEINNDAIELLKERRWIPASEKLPEEHDTIFAKLKGTDKWNKAMCEKMSDNVTVVCVFENGERVVSHSRTVDGKWDIERNPIKRTVTHWMPNPNLALPKDGEQE